MLLQLLFFYELSACVLLSAAYEVEAVGRDGTTRPFGKPWFLVLLMFAGEGLQTWLFSTVQVYHAALYLYYPDHWSAKQQ
jgi:hypothetical protein